MQLFVRVSSGIVFSLGLALSTAFQAQAAINPGGTVIEYDQDLAPFILLADVHAIIRSLPVRV